MKRKRVNIALILLLIYTSVLSQTESIDIEINGLTISGTYTIFSNDNDIDKPFVICEGFDPMNNQGAEFVRLQVNSVYDFVDNLVGNDYDVIILDFDNNTTKIEWNAELFIELLNVINQELVSNNSKHRIDVLGVSMGGLIIRYALAKMEHIGIDHRVEHYISFDSPHRGANIPLGIQQMIDTYLGPTVDVAEFISLLDVLGMAEFINQIENISKKFTGTEVFDLSQHPSPYDYSAAFEMSALYMHDNTWRQDYLNSLESIGSFPQKCRNIAVSMGTNMDNQGFEEGTSLLNYSNSYTLIDETITLLWGALTIDFDWTPMDVYTSANVAPGAFGNTTFHSYVGIQPFINFPTSFYDFSKYSTDHDNLVPPLDCNLDHAPGAHWYSPEIEGVFDDLDDWLNEMVTIDVTVNYSLCTDCGFPFGTVCADGSVTFYRTFPRSAILGELGNDTGYNDHRFCFVPTLSALGITDDDWFTDISQYSNYPHNTNITPFDAICYSNSNNYHASMPADGVVYNFLKEEIIPNNRYIQNRDFTDNYSNVFETQNITIGRDVDPVPDRTEIGDVITDASSNIDFRVPQDGSILLKDGCSLKGNIHLFTDPTYTAKVSKSSNLKPIKTKIPEKKIKKNIAIKTPETKITINKLTTVTNREIKSTVKLNDVKLTIPKTNIDIFPNPIVKEGKIYMEISTPTKVVVEIVSMQGIIVKNIINNVYQTGFFKENFDVSDLSNGIYFCKIYYNNEQKTEKLIIQK